MTDTPPTKAPFQLPVYMKPLHICHAQDCKSYCSPQYLMCRDCFWLIPDWLRDKLWDEYDLDSCKTHGQTKVAAACIEAVKWRKFKDLVGIPLTTFMEGEPRYGENLG